ncbi:MAG: hypothetical protein COX40_01320 [Candidatus Omnitrophica bacterium CG23_combo_of_CG06-09_8_20_14_all_40_11]|nr:MAG: hypothetical protein COX40_01320 [Candidatus Omnitrophica bacterium CG23_combo_of_CG06-09_8_20_14_all_40_11]
MEPCIEKISGISYLSELISTSALKFSLKILVHFTSRDTIDNIAPRVNIPKISLIFLGYASGLIRRRWRLVNEAATIYVVALRKLPAH